MPQIKRILFPVDFSDACRGAARYVEAFAAHFKAEIMLLLAAGKGEQHQAKAQLDAFLASPDLGHDPEPTHGLCFFRLPRSGMGRLVGQRISAQSRDRAPASGRGPGPHPQAPPATRPTWSRIGATVPPTDRLAPSLVTSNAPCSISRS